MCGRCDGHGATGLAALPGGPASATEKSLRLLGTLFPVSEASVLDPSVSPGPSHSGFDANILTNQLTLETFRKPFFVIPEKSAFLSKASRMPIFGSTVSRS